MLISSKNGSITAAKLISETDEAWTLEVEKRKRRLSKTDSRQRAFNDMSEALRWSKAAPELIEHFAALDAQKVIPSNQAHRPGACRG